MRRVVDKEKRMSRPVGSCAEPLPAAGASRVFFAPDAATGAIIALRYFDLEALECPVKTIERRRGAPVGLPVGEALATALELTLLRSFQPATTLVSALPLRRRVDSLQLRQRKAGRCNGRD
jgi:hypothetical protein